MKQYLKHLHHLCLKVLPYLNETEESLCQKVENSTNRLAQDLQRHIGGLRSDMAELVSVQDDVANHSHRETGLEKATFLSMLTALNSSMSEQHRSLVSQLEAYKSHTTVEISNLRIVLQHAINAVPMNMLRPLQSFVLLHMNNSGEMILENINVSNDELIDYIRARIGTLERTFLSELGSVNDVMRNQHTIMESELQDHKEQVSTGLAELQTTHGTIDSKLDSLESKQDDLQMKVMTVGSEVEANITEELEKTNTFLEASLGREEGYECGGTFGWRRVVYLDMTKPNASCPSGWRFIIYGSKNLCSKANDGGLTCDSVLFPVTGGDYTRVCGSVRAYQYDHIDAFESYHDGQATTIDSAYVSGVSLTHGSPRQHIWTFAAGSYETDNDYDACPCDASISIRIPPFVGGDYFCESGVNSGSSTSGFHPDDPLWDGSGCTTSSSCCSFNNPPYFTKQLTSSTSDGIEARLCQLDSDHSPIEFIELYVKHDTHDTIEAKLDRLESKQDELSRKVMNVSSELETNVLSNITKEMETMRNETRELLSANSDVSEELQNLTVAIQKTNSHLGEGYECGGTGGWRRVVYLDMTKPNANCPPGWQLTSYDSKNLCGKVSSGSLTCDSVLFPVTGGDYTSVCGSIRAYQKDQIDAFEPYHDGRATTIDSAYVSGVSLTHGYPRQHIWTFAAGATEAEPTWEDACPCDASISIRIPPFVGGDYFCESGVNSGSVSGFHPDDPLWDGSGCTTNSTCCSFNNPPYFIKQLPNPTSDDIEARLCRWITADDSPIEFIELYVKDNQPDTIVTKLDRLESKQDELSRKVMNVSSELETSVLSNITKEMETMRNETKELLSANSDVSEELQNLTVEIQKTNSHLGQGYECGGTGGWRRVVYLDMTKPNANCPPGWQLTSYDSKNLCGKVDTGSLTCDSVLFPVTGGDYTSVCGSIIGYQNGQIDAFESYHDGQVVTIDRAYVSGVSLTHGSPRQHIWTFAAGASEDRPTWEDACPCDASISIRIPPFVGRDYFCESGVNSGQPTTSTTYPDPLWDGSGCTTSSTCCSFNNPPYFTKQLPNPTSDDIEARLCRWNTADDSPIEFIELYVKYDTHDTIVTKLDRLESKQDELSRKVMNVSSELETNVLSNITKEMETMRNETKELLSANSDVSEELQNLTVAVLKTNSHLGEGYECGGTFGWRRVVYLDMTKPNANCPSGWQLTSYDSKSLCGKVDTGSLTCDSVLFPVTGGDYTSVCGSIIGYQNGQIDAFESYHDGQVVTIDRAYVSGVSLTHGSPRQHIWTFAAGASEDRPTWEDACPCDASISIRIPPFVGRDYFCESGVNSGQPTTSTTYPDPLWDGSGCTTSSTCCSFNNPPYFTKQLPNPTSDDIEARLCRWNTADDSPIEFIELYVKYDTHDTIVTKLDRLESKQDELSRKVMNVSSELETNVLSNITKEMETMRNETKELLSANSDVSEELQNLTVAVLKTNSHLGQGYECGGTGGWRRVVYLDMTKPNANCPPGWQLTSYDLKRLCGKVNNGGLTCDSVLFPVTGGDYTSVCGSVRAYQYSYIDAFESYHDGDATTIDSAYVSGVSLTHGSHRQHIWTFAAGSSEVQPSRDDACPCDASIDITIPPFVGGDYFCESGVNSGQPVGGTLYPDDPLWDGSGCTTSSSCCSFNNPPYFTKRLRNPTSDDIEARLCRLDAGEDTPIEFIELYVKDNQPDTIATKLDRLESKQDELSRKVTSVNSELETNVLSNITEEMETMRNETRALLSANSDVSEELQNLTVAVLKTNSHLGEGYECGGTGGWRRVVYLDMTKPNASCPSGWRFISYGSKNLCSKVNNGGLTCDSVLFPVTGGDYTSVCGSIRAYQYGIVDGFEAYHNGQATTIEGAYVTGVSLTHGSPRQHIWTFAAGYSEVQPTAVEACPCDTSRNISIPPFVGGDYFCESGVNSGLANGFHPDDPLWDGSGCTTSSSCCSFNNPPYFTKHLPNPTSDDIEVRLCRLDSDHSPIEFIELYVKHDTHDTIEAKLDRLESKQDELSRKVMNVSSELETNVLSNITKEMETMRNETKELLSANSDISEELQNLTVAVLKTNSHLGQGYECSGTGGWRRVVYLDMTKPNANCPSGWQLTSYDLKRLCGKVNNGGLTCDSVLFPVTGGDYTSVCGSVRAYQYSYIDAFESYHDGDATTIDSAYVSGVSLTHGSHRQHIWTFAAGSSEVQPSRDDACPCDASIDITIPPFVGGDYFCESGVNSGQPVGGTLYPDDPLWDGSGCTTSSSCCSFNNPPYFTKRLRNPTSDDIEARLCRLDAGEDTPIEFIELYVKDNQPDTIATKLDRLESKQDELSRKVTSVNSELETNVLSNITKEMETMRKELLSANSDVSEELQNLTVEIQKTNSRLGEGYECGGTGGWRRVVYLDMTDPTTNCPSGWQLTSYDSKNLCGKVDTGGLICDSVLFPVTGGDYTSVCGSIRAYQYGQIDAFESYHDGQATTIDSAYVSGVSLTHGTPRQHIWTFAAGASEAEPTWEDACPCDASISIRIPPFVSGDYFCESGVNSGSVGGFHPDDPLWDGSGCTNSSSCCSFNNPPYFTKQLPYPTSDDIEARLCRWNAADDSPIEFIELYVK